MQEFKKTQSSMNDTCTKIYTFEEQDDPSIEQPCSPIAQDPQSQEPKSPKKIIFTPKLSQREGDCEEIQQGWHQKRVESLMKQLQAQKERNNKICMDNRSLLAECVRLKKALDLQSAHEKGMEELVCRCRQLELQNLQCLNQVSSMQAQNQALQRVILQVQNSSSSQKNQLLCQLSGISKGRKRLQKKIYELQQKYKAKMEHHQSQVIVRIKSIYTQNIKQLQKTIEQQNGRIKVQQYEIERLKNQIQQLKSRRMKYSGEVGRN